MSPDPAFRVDLALQRLRRPNTLDDRLAALRALVEYWHGPITPADAVPPGDLVSLALPGPLSWWYRWAGRRDAIMSGQNFLMAPASADERRPYRGLLRGEGERLVFQVENQGCYFWSTLGEGNDPPVFGRHGESDPWEVEAVSLAEHLVLNCIHEAVICHAAAGASSAVLDEARFQAIAAWVPALAIGPWRWCETRFHAGAGAFMVASPVGEENGCRYYSVWLGAKCRASLAFLEPLLDETWEYVRI